MEEKQINILIILFLLVLSAKVLFDFYRRRKFYDNFMESFTNGEIRQKMLNVVNEQKVDEDCVTTGKNFEIGSLKGGEESGDRRIISFREVENIGNNKKRTRVKIGRRGMNNCLFDSVIASVKARRQEEEKNFNLPTEDSQELRDLCNKLLEKEGFPLIPDGEPAGEQYIQALSKILDCKIKIYKNHPENFVADVKHSDVSEDESCKDISIVHVGPEEHGHWVSLS